MARPFNLITLVTSGALAASGCAMLPTRSAASADRQAQALQQFAPLATAAQPVDSQMLFRLGRLELIANRPRAATEFFALLLEREPHHVEALNAAGVAVAELGRLPEAIALLRRAVAIAPDAVHARNNLGFALYRAGQLQEARAELEAALKLAPDNVMAIRNLVLVDAAAKNAAAAAAPAAAAPKEAAFSQTPPADMRAAFGASNEQQSTVRIDGSVHAPVDLRTKRPPLLEAAPHVAPANALHTPPGAPQPARHAPQGLEAPRNRFPEDKPSDVRRGPNPTHPTRPRVDAVDRAEPLSPQAAMRILGLLEDEPTATSTTVREREGRTIPAQGGRVDAAVVLRAAPEHRAQSEWAALNSRNTVRGTAKARAAARRVSAAPPPTDYSQRLAASVSAPAQVIRARAAGATTRTHAF